MLHAVTGVLAGHGVSIRAAEQEGLGPDARLFFITHDAKESAVQATVHDLRELPSVRSVDALLRVVGPAVACATSRPAARRRRSASPTRCSPAWPATAGCTSPTPGRRCRATTCSMRCDSYAATAAAVLTPFVGDDIGAADLDAMCRAAYATFRHDAVVPLVQIGHDQWLAELFHGPTLAFKDVALQLVGRLFDHVLRRRGERVTVVGATSGDTGPAAIEGVRGSDRVDIVMLYPRGGTERGAAPADDDRRCAERPRRGDRRHVRRLPGPRQGDVQRRRVPRAAAT